jgi:2-iminobutanoate/2-iminopropanoate deaminase
MSRQIISTDKVSKPRVPLSNAVRVGNLIFVSGSTPYGPDYQLAKGNFQAQMHQVMENLKSILEGAGSSLDKVVKVNVFLRQGECFSTANQGFSRDERNL